MIHCELEKKPVVIFRGDDTNFPGNAALTIQISTTEDVDFSALSAKFELLSIEKEFETIPENGLLYLEFSHEETKVLPPGSSYGVLRLIEKSTQKVRTIDDTLKFIITDCTKCAYPPKPDENFITVQFDSKMVIDWDDVKNKPTSFPTTWDNISGKPSLVKTVNGIAPDANGNVEVEGGDEGGVAELMIPITYADLKILRNSSQLVPGMQYRITDYVATTKNAYTKSANHPFDIIVTADNEGTLNEVARAIRHDGDTYFANCKLEAWKIWYCFDNDESRFEWATSSEKIGGVTVAGKGVIYRMIDEWDNDVPYDFKGILTRAYIGNNSWSSDFCYTFGLLEDTTVSGMYVCHSNKIGVYFDTDGKQQLNQIVFGPSCFGNTFDRACFINYIESECYHNTFGSYCTNNVFDSYCSYNTFGSGCSYNTFGLECTNNVFDPSCYSNTFGSGCSSNTFGSGCYSNTFESDCTDNTFGSYCTDNTFGSGCYSNTFESDCTSNEFGLGCSYNNFGSGCVDNNFGSGCSYNNFGSGCESNIFGLGCTNNEFGSGCCYNWWNKDYLCYIDLQSGAQFITLDIQSTSSNQLYRNVEIKSGVNMVVIADDNVNQSFHTTYKPVGSMEVSV